MNIPPNVTELLRAGYGDRTIARQTGVTISSVTAARAELGLPKARGGHKKAASAEDLFWRRVRPVDGDDGHLEWTGHRNSKGTPTFGWDGGRHSALRVAYRIRHGHNPEGYAFVACEHEGCVAPGHIGDSAVTARPAHHRKARGRRPNGTDEQVIALLRKGLADKAVARRFQTSPRRVARLRAEQHLTVPPRAPLSFAERWVANTEQVEGGHLRWTGRFRTGNAPAVTDGGRSRSVRAAAFERHHGRAPDGPVLPGCGEGWCVRPEHLEDRIIRDRTNQIFTAIFGVAS